LCCLVKEHFNVQVCKALKIYKIEYIKNIPLKKEQQLFVNKLYLNALNVFTAVPGKRQN
jgi:hypothetical protein